jgi:hypothetical protein
MVTVYNVAAGEEVAKCTCDARTAVIAAYAQSRNDLNTWEYENKYGRLAKKTKYGWVCGDFWVHCEEDRPQMSGQACPVPA